MRPGLTVDEPSGPAVRPPSWRPLVPCGLTVARLLLGLVFPWLSFPWRVAAILTAALTDFLDGWASRRLDAATVVGRFLDVLADKVFILIVLFTLLAEGALTWPALVLLNLRELLVLAGGGWAMAREGWACLRRFRPSWYGKAATWAQFGYLFVLLASPPLAILLFPIPVVLSGLAGLGYARGFLARPLGVP